MGLGLDTPTPTRVAANQDSTLAGLHDRLLQSAQSQSDPLRIADSTADFIPGPQGTPVKVADASSPPPLVPTEIRPAAQAVNAEATAAYSGGADPVPTAGAQVARTDTPTPVVAGATDQSATGAANSFAYGDAGSSCDDKSICSWRPNPNSTSQLTKDWFAAQQTQAAADVDCNYKVKFGDDLTSIARRELKKEGKEGSSIKDEVAKIIRLNHDHYKSLDCNSDFIKAGWTLKLDDKCTTAAAPPQQAEAPPPPAPVTSGDACKKDCPDVIVDDPTGQTYFNGKLVGDHDRTIIKDGQTREVPIPYHDGGHRQRAEQPGAKVADAPQPVVPAAPETKLTPEAPVPAPKPAAARVETAAQTDTPAPLIPGRVIIPAGAPANPTETQAPKDAQTPAQRDAQTNDDLIPGPPEVQAAAAPVAPPLAKPAAPAPKPAEVQTSSASSGFIGDGNSLGP